MRNGASGFKEIIYGNTHRRTHFTRPAGLSLHRHDLAGEILNSGFSNDLSYESRTLGWIQLALYLGMLLLITKPLGLYLLQVLDAKGSTWLDPIVRPVERLTYRLCGIDPEKEQHWKHYTISMLIFSLVTMLVTYAILRLQAIFPLQHLFNPQGFSGRAGSLAFNTAASFTTNTNWQSYGGESTMSYFSQMVALVSQNFFSAAVGIAIAAALVRGIARHCADDHRQFLGGSRPHHLLSAAADLPRFRDVPDVAGHDPEFQALRRGRPDRKGNRPGAKTDANGNPVKDAQGKPVMVPSGGRHADHPARPDGLADRDQDARHQWRRLHQRQRRASV